MPNWQVTATTVYCNGIEDEVTIQVFKDWSAKCTGPDKYNECNKDVMNTLKKKSKRLGRPLSCTGTTCDHINKYKEKLAAEEAKSKASA